MNNQTTIVKPVKLSGVGIHSGRKVELTFKPAAANFGYAFCRTDLEGKPIIEADANLVVNTKRGTNLQKNGVNIQTSEHVLAALVGLEIDNVLIELNSPEPPIMDGSAKFFVEALLNAGIEELDVPRYEYIVEQNISYFDEESGSEITIIPSKNYQVTSMVDFGTKVLGTQNATMKDISDFKDNFANARTFSFLHEIESLLENGLIKGGDLNNAIVYVDKKGKQHAELIEVKPESQTRLTEKTSHRDKLHVAINHAKWEAAAKFCRMKGLVFRIVTENDIFHQGNKR